MKPKILQRVDELEKDVAENVSALADIAINIRNFPKQIPETDDTARIQRAINNANDSGGGTIFFPEGTYVINTPVTLYSNITIEGLNYKTILKKTSETTKTGLSATFLKDNITQTVNFNEPVFFNILFPNSSYAINVNINNITFNTDGNSNIGIIHAPRIAHSSFKNLRSNFSKFFYKSLDGWMMSFENIRSRYSDRHFEIMGGTSNYFKNVHCDQKSTTGSLGQGFYISGLQYSIFEGCGADTLTQSYFITGKSNVTLSGCGAESHSNSIIIQDSTVSINGGMLEFHLVDSISGLSRTPWVFENNAIVTLNGVKFVTADFTSTGAGDWSKISKPIIRTGAKVTMNGVEFDITNIVNDGSIPYIVLNDNSFVSEVNANIERKVWSTGSRLKNKLIEKTQKINKNISVPFNTKTELFRISDSIYGSSIIGNAVVRGFTDAATGTGGQFISQLSFTGIDRGTDINQNIVSYGESKLKTRTANQDFTLSYTVERGTNNDLVVYLTITSISTYNTFDVTIDINAQCRVGNLITAMRIL